MKTTVFPHTVAFLLLGAVSPLFAQNLECAPHFAADSRLQADGQQESSKFFSEAARLPGGYELPPAEKVRGVVEDEASALASQDARTLKARLDGSRKVETVVDLNVLRNPSPYQRVMVSGRTGVPYEVMADSLQQGLAEVSAAYRETGKAQQGSDCEAIGLSVGQRIKLEPAAVLEVVEKEVSANPDCACETVKVAIKAIDADAEKVVVIAEAAILAAPEAMRMISQCAIAANPDALPGVQSLLARLDPNGGETGYSSKGSAKGSKGAKVASIAAPPLPNPLDLPPPFPPLPPPPIVPPVVTSVDP